MEFIPAIDLLAGKVVRLHKGDYAQVTVYSDDPAGQAKLFRDAGARRLHVVDLDGARDGKPGNRHVIEQILKAAPELLVQVGGGIRSREAAEAWYQAGATRVVLGTVAIKNPELARSLCAEHPDGVVMALDAKGGMIAVEGWLEATGKPVHEVAAQADAWGTSAILFTDIDRDGTREGPAVEATAKLQAQVKATVIASGGIGALEHLAALREAGVRSAVCGRALYSGAFTLAQAFRVCAGEG
ncbi:MAG: 1-(5-phosphoribosyl)-5-[(5-phosphoribosylamino)methylideneamino]imidazole-4-carboxamide isomerase [Myxococcales bacterium]